ncbi:hypothetical protein M758_UG295800 [Ceratodon purpureus]|nr:hypothetical protein M758_UG295800 [Ceratodon purpureus]
MDTVSFMRPVTETPFLLVNRPSSGPSGLQLSSKHRTSTSSTPKYFLLIQPQLLRTLTYTYTVFPLPSILRCLKSPPSLTSLHTHSSSASPRSQASCPSAHLYTPT